MQVIAKKKLKFGLIHSTELDLLEKFVVDVGIRSVETPVIFYHLGSAIETVPGETHFSSARCPYHQVGG
jgi:hypothetical protein